MIVSSACKDGIRSIARRRSSLSYCRRDRSTVDPDPDPVNADHVNSHHHLNNHADHHHVNDLHHVVDHDHVERKMKMMKTKKQESAWT